MFARSARVYAGVTADRSHLFYTFLGVIYFFFCLFCFVFEQLRSPHTTLHFTDRPRQVAESKLHAALVCFVFSRRQGWKRKNGEKEGSSFCGKDGPDDAQCVTKDIRSGGGVTTGHKDLSDGDDTLCVCVCMLTVQVT